MKPLVLSAFLAFPAHAQGYSTPSCIPDSITIRDAGEGRAILTYSNSVDQCSAELVKTLTSPNGIAVEVQITLGGKENEYRERIELRPLTDGYFAVEPEGELLDGEVRDFLIVGGVS
jgi:hypothetical protein